MGVRGPAKTFSPIRLLDVQLNATGSIALDFPAHENLGLLVMKGDVTIHGDARAETHDFVVFGHTGEGVQVRANTEAQLLVMNGEPIGEPIVQNGPFVMNSQREIAEAFADFNRGKFGHLDD